MPRARFGECSPPVLHLPAHDPLGSPMLRLPRSHGSRVPPSPPRREGEVQFPPSNHML